MGENRVCVWCVDQAAAPFLTPYATTAHLAVPICTHAHVLPHRVLVQRLQPTHQLTQAARTTATTALSKVWGGSTKVVHKASIRVQAGSAQTVGGQGCNERVGHLGVWIGASEGLK